MAETALLEPGGEYVPPAVPAVSTGPLLATEDGFPTLDELRLAFGIRRGDDDGSIFDGRRDG